jgi:Kdo2-lipid IVA lauroyltransferase/acyltransferase
MLARLPRRWLLALGRTLGGLAYLIGIRRGVALGNLARAFPEKSTRERRRIARAAYRNVGAGVLGLLSVPRLSAAEVEQLVEYQGFELVDRLLAEGRGLVVASAHLGSWEVLAAAYARKGIPVSLVTRNLRGRANEALVAARAESGLREIAPRGALREGVAALKRGEMVVNLIDQNMLPKRGVFVDFFGTAASTTPAPALMARRAKAPAVVILAVNQSDGRIRACVEGPFPVPHGGRVAEDVRAHTQAMSDVVEKYVRNYPEQWLWVHRRWKTRPTSE